MYTHSRLAINPFPRISIPEYPPRVTFDPQRILEKIKKEALYTINTKFSNTFVIVGPYGSGKTYYMLKALSELSRLENVLAVYIPSPGKSIMTVHRAFIEALGTGGLLKLAGDDDQLGRLLKLLGDEEHGRLVYAWLCGEAIESSFRYKLGLGERLDDATGVRLLSELISRLWRRGITTLLFLDEVESILELQPYKREPYFSSLRRLIDLTTRGLFLTFSVTPAGWDAMLNYAYALARRISRNVVFIRPLTLEEAKELISRYLAEVENGSQIFTSKAVEELYRASNGVTGELLKLAGLALDVAISKGANYVDRDAVVEALSIYGGARAEFP